MKIKIPAGARSAVIRKQYEKEDISGKWAATSTSKRLAAREAKQSLNDFGRFKAKVSRQVVSQHILSIEN